MTNNIQQLINSTQPSVKFLNQWNPKGPWVLTSIAVDKKGIETRTFYPDKIEQLEGWLKLNNRDRNIYFHVNSVTHDLSKKANRQDIKSVDFLHVDIDPEVGYDLEEERERILKLLTEKLPKTIPEPTLIVFSGGGFQGFWKLKDPIPVNGDLGLAEDAKLYNKQLEKDFNADSCHNIDRLMRLPGTWNIPDKKKREKGRKKELAKVIKFNNNSYPPSNFQKFIDKKAEGINRNSSIGISKYKCTLSKFIEPVTNIEDILKIYKLPDDVARICKYGTDPENPKRDGDNSRSAWLFSPICRMIKYLVPDEVIYSIITDQKFLISESVLDKKEDAHKYAIRQIEKAHEFINESSSLILYDSSPLNSAKVYLRRYLPNLIHTNGDFLAYNGTFYEEVEISTIKSELYGFLDKQQTIVKKNTYPFNPTKDKISKIIDAAKGHVHKPRNSFAPPCWIEDTNLPDPKDIIACQNGLLHLPTRNLFSPTPNFFNRNALSFEYLPDIGKAKKWFKFLNDLLPNDIESQQTLQEIFGYVLTTDTSLQKIFLIIGPKRSGKGTIAKVLSHLIGLNNICSPTLNNLSGDFGLQPLIGKQLVIVSDMRIGNKTDQAALAENLLRISGEDSVTANRKYKEEWSGQLNVRFIIMTNEIPRLNDSSGALASRFIPLIITKSFFGRENPNLTNELLEELPAILNWAIDGWQHLKDRGHFVLPENSKNALQALSDLASPITAFIRDECKLDNSAITPKADLYEAYKDWNSSQGCRYTPVMSVFARDLMSALQGQIKVTKPTIGESRTPCYSGIRIKKAPKQNNIPF